MKLNIAQITPYYYPSIGGVSGVAQYISEELAKLGNKVDVITTRRDHKGRPKLSAPKTETINGVNIFRYRSLFNIGHMSFFPGLIAHLIKNKYDVIHYHSYRHPLCDISSFVGKLRSSITVLHGHGPFFEKGEISLTKARIYNLYDKIAKRTVLKWSDSIIALNAYEKNRYIKIGIKPDKIHVIQNAACSEAFLNRDRDKFRINLGLCDKKVMLFVGILNGFKRPDLLIKALPFVLKNNPEAHLILVGPDGGMLDEVQELGKSLNVENNYSWIGPKYGEEKFSAFAGSDVFVLPSDWEGYPVVIAEAMATSLPVITTNIRGPIEMVDDNIDGIIINKGDINGLANALIKIISDDELRTTLSYNARLKAEKKYSAASVTKSIESVYCDLINNFTSK